MVDAIYGYIYKFLWTIKHSYIFIRREKGRKKNHNGREVNGYIVCRIKHHILYIFKKMYS